LHPQPPLRHQVAKLGVVVDRDDFQSRDVECLERRNRNSLPCFAFPATVPASASAIGNASAVVNVLDVYACVGRR
jgi:hypothetical protein